MDVRELTATEDRRDAVPILRQLWDDADPEDVLEWTGEAEYHLFGGYADGRLVGVAGILVQDVLHHTRHAWLYDLVVDEPVRGQGYGTALVKFVERWADEQKCTAVALASPLEKEATHEFYGDLEYEKWGYVIEKDL